MAMKFYDPKNDEFIETEDVESEENYAKGVSLGLQAVSDVTDVQSGETHTIDRSELKQALNSGRFVIPQLYEAKQVEKSVQSENISPLSAAGMGFAKSATSGAASAVGGLEAMRQGKDYGSGRRKYVEREDAAFDKFPSTYGLGYTAGVLPGIAAKGLTTLGQIGVGALTPLIGNAVKVDEPVTKERALETAGDVATGALFGGLGALGGRQVPNVATAAGEMAERRATKAIGADVLKPQRRIERMPGGRQAFGRELLDSGIVTAGKNVKGMKTKADDLSKISGEAIGKAMREFDQTIGVPSVNRASLVGEIENIPIEIAKNPAKSAIAQRINSSFVEPMKEWAKNGDAATLEEVWEIRSALDDLAFTPTGLDKPLNKELQKIRKIMESRLQKTAESAGISKERLAAYERAKRVYQVSKETVLTTKEKMDRMQANRAISLTDYLSGGAGAGAGATIGGPVGGTLGAVLGAIGNKISRERGPQVAAATLDKLSAIMKSNPQAFQQIIATFARTGAIELGE